jgi:hypothetical protein
MPFERSRGISLIDAIERVLDKGIVIDNWARVHLLGIDVLTRVEARVIVASIDTYVEYADRIGRTGTLARRLSSGAFDVGFAREK